MIDSAGPTFTEGPSLLSVGGRALIVGPGHVEGTALRVWSYANAVWRDVAVTGTHVMRVGAAAVYDHARRKIVITGGAQSGATSIGVIELDVDR